MLGWTTGALQSDRVFTQVEEAVGTGRPGRMLVVELQECPLAVADLEEAHDATGVVGVLAVGLTPKDCRCDTLGVRPYLL